MSDNVKDGPLIIFSIRVPWASAFGGSTEVLVEGSVSADRQAGRALSGVSSRTESHDRAALGNFSIVWKPGDRTAACTFSSSEDGLSDFEFEGDISPSNLEVLSGTVNALEIARCLLSAAEDFEPSLPPPELLAAHPYMARVLPGSQPMAEGRDDE